MTMRVPGCDDDVNNAGPVVQGLRLLDAAAKYCALGDSIFWLRGKQPLVSKDDGGNGFHDATSDYAALLEVFKRFRGATGVGQPIALGTFVLDVDPGKGGNESLAALEREHGSLPTTKEQLTGTGGRHLVFSTSLEIRQVAGFRPGLDTRAAGRGYIVVEPSIHPDTGKRYQWIRRMPPAVAPAWLLEFVAAKPEPERKPYTPPKKVSDAHLSRRQRFAQAVLRGVARKVAEGAEGSRNDLLNWAWFKVAGFRDVLDETEARSALLNAAAACGLSEREALKVLR